MEDIKKDIYAKLDEIRDLIQKLSIQQAVMMESNTNMHSQMHVHFKEDEQRFNLSEARQIKLDEKVNGIIAWKNQLEGKMVVYGALGAFICSIILILVGIGAKFIFGI